MIECDTLMCNHCNGIVKTEINKPVDDFGGTCKQCMSFVCLGCYAVVGCTPFEKRIAEMEARDMHRRAYEF